MAPNRIEEPRIDTNEHEKHEKEHRSPFRVFSCLSWTKNSASPRRAVSFQPLKMNKEIFPDNNHGKERFTNKLSIFLSFYSLV